MFNSNSKSLLRSHCAENRTWTEDSISIRKVGTLKCLSCESEACQMQSLIVKWSELAANKDSSDKTFATFSSFLLRTHHVGCVSVKQKLTRNVKVKLANTNTINGTLKVWKRYPSLLLKLRAFSLLCFRINYPTMSVECQVSLKRGIE